MENPRAAASVESFFGQRDRIRQTFRLGKFLGLEFIFMLVVVARIALPDQSLLMRSAQNVLVSRSELEIYHCFALMIVFEN